jgi:AcrR family transcriptional regulator
VKRAPRTPEPDAEPREPGLRERKKERVREQLMDAAVKLFSRKGLDATTIDDIVGAVEVSRRTFFRYFDAKEDVLPAWFDTHVASLLATIDDRPAGEAPMLSLRFVMEGIAEVYQSKIASILTIERVISREPSLTARRFVRLEQMAEGLAKRLSTRGGKASPSEAEVRLLARLALSVGNSAIERWALGGGKGNLREVLDGCWREAEAGFRVAPRKRRS